MVIADRMVPASVMAIATMASATMDIAMIQANPRLAKPDRVRSQRLRSGYPAALRKPHLMPYAQLHSSPQPASVPANPGSHSANPSSHCNVFVMLMLCSSFGFSHFPESWGNKQSRKRCVNRQENGLTMHAFPLLPAAPVSLESPDRPSPNLNYSPNPH